MQHFDGNYSESADRGRTIRAVAFCAIVALAVGVLNFLLYPWSGMSQGYQAFDDVESNIDLLILGDSLERASIDEDMMREYFGMSTYNFHIAAGHPECYYYMLLDALTRHGIKAVIVGYDILQQYQQPYDDDKTELHRVFLRRSRGNWELFVFAASSLLETRYTTILFKFSAYLDNFDKVFAVLRSHSVKRQAMQGQVKANADAAVKEADEDDTDSIIEPRGKDRITHKHFAPPMRPNDKKYFAMMKRLCDAHKIPLIVTACAVPEMSQEVPGVTDCIEDMRHTMDELGITYIDTNDQNYFPGSTYKYNYYDWVGHYHTAYRPVHTRQLCTYIKNVLGGLQ